MYSNREEIEDRYNELKEQYDEIVEKSSRYNDLASRKPVNEEILDELYADITKLQESFTDTEKDEMDELKAVLDELPQFVELVYSDDFSKHAQQTAEDMAPRGVDFGAWPYNHINWNHAENELSLDYTHIEIWGIDYYYREA